MEMLIADAVLQYEAISGDAASLCTAFVELDRATMAIESLVAKLGRYVRLEGYMGAGPERRAALDPLWREYYSYFPPVLVVLANGLRRRLRRRRQVMLALWEREHEAGSPIDLRICLYEELLCGGPFAPIFRDAADPASAVDWLGRGTSATEPARAWEGS